MRQGTIKSIVSEMRPRQWVKNLFVVAPLFFSQNAFVAGAAERAVLALALFCLSSSSVYLLNDLGDRHSDSLHPEKRRRPIASGALGVKTAFAVMVVLLAVSLGGSLLLGPEFLGVLIAYWAVNVLYTHWLKHRVILDVFAVSSGFLLRVVGGGVAIGVELSHWLFLCTALIALFLGFSKRRHELVLLGDDADSHRVVLGEYNAHFLDMMIAIVTACTLMSYALYTMSEETVHKFHTRNLFYTFPFVLYGIFRYLYLVYSKSEGGDPTQDLFSDLPTVANLSLWAATVGLILYWH